ncbi:NAD-dependent epimerase/dehydratase family protein [Acidobacteriota bacterium]
MNVKRKKVLVTGAAGFIGSHLVEYLLTQKCEVVCLVYPGENLRWIEGLDVTLVEGNITKKEDLYTAVQGVQFIYHLAGKMGGWSSPELLYNINSKGTKLLLEVCCESNVKLERFIFASSMAVMGNTGKTEIYDESRPPNPKSDYGKSKLLAEKYLSGFNLSIPYTILRLPLVYGPRGKRGLNAFFRLANKRISILVEKTYTNVGYVEDIVKGMFLAAHSPAAVGKTYFLGENQIYNSEEIVRLIARAVGKRTIKISLPYPLLYSLAAVIEGTASLTKSHPIVRKKYLSEYLKSHWRFSIEKAAIDFNFTANFPLAEGLKLTSDWYKEHGFKL